MGQKAGVRVILGIHLMRNHPDELQKQFDSLILIRPLVQCLKINDRFRCYDYTCLQAPYALFSSSKFKNNTIETVIAQV